jgi:type I restriction enzyme R subunit
VPLEELLTLAARGVANEDLASTLASRFVRLELRMDGAQRRRIQDLNEGRDLGNLSRDLLQSIDPDRQDERAAELAVELQREPTEQERAELERDMVREALRPLHNPDLRETILSIRRSLDQVMDEANIDELLQAGHDEKALERARELVGGFRRFIEENRERIEALQILYSRPYRAGLRYHHATQLAAALKASPLQAEPRQVWEAYRVVEPGQVKGVGGKQLADVVALVRHALVPEEPLVPVAQTVEYRYRQWLAEQEAAGVTFTQEQSRWLEAIRDHIATSLHIEADDFGFVPFSQYGGLGRAYELFGERLQPMMEELNERLTA